MTSARGLGVVDCDIHCAVPAVAALYPYFDEHWENYLKESAYKRPRGETFTYPAWSDMLATPGADLTLERLQDDVLEGVDLGILQCYYAVETEQHPYLAAALASAVNDWLRAEWLDRDERLRASVVVTPQFAQAAADEIRRVGGDPRFVQVLLPARAWDPYGHPRYWPIWEAAAQHGLVLGLTFGGASGVPSSPVGWLTSFFEEYALGSQAFQAHLVSLVFSGAFERFPGLKVTVMESGCTWLPPLMWRMDQEWKAARRETPWLTVPPSEYVRRHVRLTTSPLDAPASPEHLRAVLEQLPAERVLMYGSDHPHKYEPAGHPLEALLDPDRLERVMAANALEHYGLAATPRAAAPGPTPSRTSGP